MESERTEVLCTIYYMGRNVEDDKNYKRKDENYRTRLPEN